MKDKNELLSEMEKAMDRYDLSKEIEKARIGEWMYGVAMVPCDWVYEYVKQPEIIRCKDCMHGRKHNIDIIECMKAHDYNLERQEFHHKNWFCADGERKSADEILMEEMDADPLG